MWTQAETVQMTINIVVVSESILIDQSTEREPEVIQFKRWKISVSLKSKYSKKIIQEKIVAIDKKEVVKIWDTW